MAQQSSANLGMINIKAHPHSPEIYVSLFRKAMDAKVVGRVRGDVAALIAFWNPITVNNPQAGIFGELYKFVNINPEQPWLNLQDVRPVEVDETHPMPVPEHLKPNLRRIPFAFFPEQHRFIFDTKHLSPGGARKAMESIFAHPAIRDAFGSVDVEMETSREALERLLAVPRKTKIVIDLTVPNPDDVSGEEAEVMRRLIESRVRRQHLEQSSNHPQGIAPDSRTKAMMSLSLSNGKATVIGYEGGTRVQESTEQHPLLWKVHYDPNAETMREAMVSSASQRIAEIIRSRNA